MNIFDCVMYFDEDLNLDLRFNILDKYVDKFVVVEATRNHAGEEKRLNFDINKFKKFERKINYLVVDDIPKEVKNYKKGWSPNFYRENFNRNAISRALTECSPNDLILISDADEIPNLELLNEIKINKFAIFKQRFFIYKLNLLYDENWLGSSICYKKYLKSPQWLRNKRFLRRGFFRRIFFKTQILNNGGWHFSFLKKPEKIIKKIKNYAHSEYKDLDDIEKLKKQIENKIYFIDPSQKLIKINIDKTYPRYLEINKDLYSDWIS